YISWPCAPSLSTFSSGDRDILLPAKRRHFTAITPWNIMIKHIRGLSFSHPLMGRTRVFVLSILIIFLKFTSNVSDNITVQLDPGQLIHKTCLNCLKTFLGDDRAYLPFIMLRRKVVEKKHPESFKSASKSQVKQWLTEAQHIRGAGGKMAYVLLEQDIKDLAVCDEYMYALELKLDEPKPFTLCYG
uniref:TdIF1 C-terminal domain-containing protein n=1 Tax=Leptobrachium leishanense TaxID=445787 RepID=A0A8C5LVW7_9ANUR